MVNDNDSENGRAQGQAAIGAALVVGGGIGGMQAALDLAEAGIKVYLLERSPAIGGTMAQLDKTFPTNDCAMCIMSPKLVEVGRHLNIEILTMAELAGLAGEPGNFRATVRQHPRYVNLAACTGCGDCAAVCPVRRPDAFNQGLSQRRAIYKPYPQAIPNAYAIEKLGLAPCRAACPINQRAQGYVALIGEERYADAYRTIKADNPFPSVCGRICNRRCEAACSRGKADAPVNLMGLKRFAADWAMAHRDGDHWLANRSRGRAGGKAEAVPAAGGSIAPLNTPSGGTFDTFRGDAARNRARHPPLGDGQGPAQPSNATQVRLFEQAPQGEGVVGKKVAVVGAGPAGLTCALGLARRGYAVTVYEALPVAGGMMRVGVPEYRLPYDLVQKEIADIVAEGVELVLNHHVEDVPALLQAGFEAVFVALGAHQGIKLPIPGADLPQVLIAADFLRAVSLRHTRSVVEASSCAGESPATLVAGKRVLVLGGGNVAVDTAMSAVRLGASWAGLACLESREDMPAHAWEIRDAEEEGIEIFPSRTFKEIRAEKGEVRGVRCAEIDFRGFKEGRPDFVEWPGTEHLIPADVVIFAIGQRPEIKCLGEQVKTIGGRFPAVDPKTLATSLPGVFAGGDVVTGTAFIVDAIAAGQRAARSIDRYLRGEPLHTETDLAGPAALELDEGEIRRKLTAGPPKGGVGQVSPGGRTALRKRPAAERRRDFNEIYLGLAEAEARAEAERCLACGICAECLQCVYACQANAIEHNQVEKTIELQVGAVILTPGLEPVGDIGPEFGYGRYPNVVTSLEFERMLSASGPFGGLIQRPSDQARPRKIAWIQCVGSREIRCNRGYCSSVCCMAAAKEAIIAKEHDPRIEPTIFYMDIRAFGKGFDRYVERAERADGLRYVRSMVSSVKEAPQTGNLRLNYATFAQNGRAVQHEEEFELVVLAVGLKPSAETQEMARRLEIRLNAYGFAEPPAFQPGRTSRPGVYVAGGLAEPKDIPETVIEAGCAAAQASALLAEARGTLTREAVYPPERDVSAAAPRVGVFVCHCGVNIGSVVNVPAVVEYAERLPDVVYAEQNLYTCSQDTQEKIAATVQRHDLNRVVVASCTPRTHEPLFQETIRQAGLNPHLFELANIREQVSWVHRATPEVATEKAKALVAMAVAKARRLRPIQRQTFDLARRALVVGGGLAGMTAALSIAAQGFPVYLVEREKALGGQLGRLHLGLNDSDPQQLLRETIAQVSRQPLIRVFLESELEQIGGYVGQFRTVVRAQDGTRHELAHGAVVVATGGRQIETKAYGYGQLAGVITQRELEAELANSRGGAGAAADQASSTAASSGRSPARSIVMIQCVDSRDEDHPYCSRICCSQALKNALAIRRRSPETEVAILYRDLRSYGFRERLYREARRAGVLFLRFEPKSPPQVSRSKGCLQVQTTIQPEGEQVELAADRVVLSVGLEAEPGNEQLSQLLKLPLHEDGFFLEAHVKLRPVDFAADGVYLCGLAHGPRAIDETIAQAQAAAIRAAALLARKQLIATPIVASVNPRLCAACGLCVEACPYGARILEPGMSYAEVVEVLCQGCGACIVACPNKASQQKGFEFLQTGAMLEATLATV